MPAWSLSGSLLLVLAAPAVGDRGTAPERVRGKADGVVLHNAYRMPGARQPVALVVDDVRTLSTSQRDLSRDRRVLPTSAAAALPVIDPANESVRLLLRDRMARRPGALDARVEWRLTGSGSDLGLGGGLARIVGTLLHD